jgi:hypothetical protein
MGALEAQAWPCAEKRPPTAGTVRGKIASGEFRSGSAPSSSADPERCAPRAALGEAATDGMTGLWRGGRAA